MAIERGVNDSDKFDLDIEDRSKEIEITVNPDIEEMFAGVDDDDNEILEDGTMPVSYTHLTLPPISSV